MRHGITGTHRLAMSRRGSGLISTVPATVDNLRWEADPLDWMDQQILAAGTHEPEIISELLTHLNRGDVFWDVGANAGAHALRVKQAMPDVTVIAFEPSPVQFGRLLHHALINTLDVDCYCIALADQRGYRQLSVRATGNSGHTSLTPWDGVAYDQAFSCWCDTADNLIESGVPAPDVVKIDVEGAEQLVLAGMDRTLDRVRCLVVETEDPGRLEERGFSLRRLSSTGGGVDWIAAR